MMSQKIYRDVDESMSVVIVPPGCNSDPPDFCDSTEINNDEWMLLFQGVKELIGIACLAVCYAFHWTAELINRVGNICKQNIYVIA